MPIDGMNVIALYVSGYNGWESVLMDLMGLIGEMFACLGGIMLPPQSSRRFATSTRMRWMTVLPDSTSDADEAEEIAGRCSTAAGPIWNSYPRVLRKSVLCIQEVPDQIDRRCGADRYLDW